jgi:hypothetical protein
MFKLNGKEIRFTEINNSIYLSIEDIDLAHPKPYKETCLDWAHNQDCVQKVNLDNYLRKDRAEYYLGDLVIQEINTDLAIRPLNNNESISISYEALNTEIKEQFSVAVKEIVKELCVVSVKKCGWKHLDKLPFEIKGKVKTYIINAGFSKGFIQEEEDGLYFNSNAIHSFIKENNELEVRQHPRANKRSIRFK